MKSVVYTDKPASVAALKAEIQRAICEIPTAKWCEKNIQNLTDPMNHLNRSRDQHLYEIILKK